MHRVIAVRGLHCNGDPSSRLTSQAMLRRRCRVASAFNSATPAAISRIAASCLRIRLACSRSVTSCLATISSKVCRSAARRRTRAATSIRRGNVLVLVKMTSPATLPSAGCSRSPLRPMAPWSQASGVNPPMDGRKSSHQRVHDNCRAAHLRENDCVAGVGELELRNVDVNYLFERSHRFAGIQPNSGCGDYSRLSCGAGIRGSGVAHDLGR
jgi:hypothetical protein